MDLSALSQRFAEGNQRYFAAIRLPGAGDTCWYFYGTTQPRLEKVEVSGYTSPVFLCAPYGAGNLAYVFKPGKVMHGDRVVYEIPETENPVMEAVVLHPNFYADAAFYQQLVSKGVQEIKSKRVKKIVAARAAVVELSQPFNRAKLFQQTAEQYPDACIYYFSFGSQGTWFGATPERLLELDRGKLTTVALAGTRRQGDATPWSEKEREEQGITAAFIREAFKAGKMNDFKETAVETIQAGNLQHLCAGFAYTGEPEYVRKQFPRFLSRINPTPAVCGDPQSEAFSFLAEHEKLERRFYSGFVGMATPEKASLFVNIRCMELAMESAILYAGAGITSGSDPVQEWEETAAKMETLSRLL